MIGPARASQAPACRMEYKMNQNQKDNLAEALGIDRETQSALDSGSNHDYRCTCDTCLRWWVEMGPDGMEPGNYGPFTRDQVVTEAVRLGKPTEDLL